MVDKIQEDELMAWGDLESRFVNILNKTYPLDEAIADIKFLRNTIWYTGSNEKYIPF